MATVEERLAECEQRSKSNTHRIDKLEEDRDAINKMATSIALMAQKLTTIDSKMDGVSEKVDTLEKLPAKRWESLVEKVIAVLVSILLGYLFARIGITP